MLIVNRRLLGVIDIYCQNKAIFLGKNKSAGRCNDVCKDLRVFAIIGNRGVGGEVFIRERKLIRERKVTLKQ